MPTTITGTGTFTGATTINGLSLPSDNLQPGLNLINTTTFSAASTVSVNNCFSSLYQNYRIIINASATVDQGLAIRMRSSGTDNTTAAYTRQRIYGDNTSIVGSRNASDTSWISGQSIYTSANGNSPLSLDIYDPYIATYTSYTSLQAYSYAGSTLYISSGLHAVSNIFDGLTIYISSGTLTGTLRIYGYRN
jgi:hypothetical protein